MNLSDAIDAYLEYRRGAGFSKNTVKASEQGLKKLLACVGNVRVKSLSPVHGERFYAYLAGHLGPQSTNIHLSAAAAFFKWCRLRKFMQHDSDPLGTVRAARVAKRPRRRIDAVDFPRLLDSAATPQHRIVVALGLYLFLRSSEIVALSVGDVRLDRGEVVVYQPKTSQYDEMPICAELDAELRRWLTFYTEQCGLPDEDWPLVPAMTGAQFVENNGGKNGGIPGRQKINPKRRMTSPHRPVQLTLERFGWALEGEREGGHTLRRSGARALFEELCESGVVRDNVLRQVSAMLHHKSVTVTEGYLGLEADVEKRNNLLKGRRMFAEPEGVSTLKVVSE